MSEKKPKRAKDLICEAYRNWADAHGKWTKTQLKLLNLMRRHSAIDRAHHSQTLPEEISGHFGKHQAVVFDENCNQPVAYGYAAKKPLSTSFKKRWDWLGEFLKSSGKDVLVVWWMTPFYLDMKHGDGSCREGLILDKDKNFVSVTYGTKKFTHWHMDPRISGQRKRNGVKW